MIKIIITGGDNCYCCRCGGICDRAVMEIDTEKKTLRYIDGHGLCLGKYCWSKYVCDDGTILERHDVWSRHGVRVRVRAYRDGVELPCVVKHSKWGKDGEYGSYGSSFWSKYNEKINGWELKDWKSKDCERDYWEQDWEHRESEPYVKATGWILEKD